MNYAKPDKLCESPCNLRMIMEKQQGHALRALALQPHLAELFVPGFYFFHGLSRLGFLHNRFDFHGFVLTGSPIVFALSNLQLLLFTVPLGMTVLHKVAPDSAASAILAPLKSASVRSA